MGFYIYGKRAERVEIWDGRVFEPHSRFAALDARGHRVSKLCDAKLYETKEAAQEILDKVRKQPGVVFEIRKAK